MRNHRKVYTLPLQQPLQRGPILAAAATGVLRDPDGAGLLVGYAHAPKRSEILPVLGRYFGHPRRRRRSIGGTNYRAMARAEAGAQHFVLDDSDSTAFIAQSTLNRKGTGGTETAAADDDDTIRLVHDASRLIGRFIASPAVIITI